MTPPHGRPAVVVVQTIVPHYRVAFFERLAAELGPALLLASGEEDWSRDLSHVHGAPHEVVRNRFLLRRRLLWQSGVVSHALDASVAVLVLNPRIITSWAVLALRAVRGRRTLLWGHAWPRAGPTSRTDRVRHLMRRLASGLIVYTESEAEQAKKELPGRDVVAAPNALYSRADLEPGLPERTPTDFVFVGRLNREKRPDLLVAAFRETEPQLPSDARVVFVGDGPLRPALEAAVREWGLAERIVFCGHVSELEELRRVYACAIASILPGTAGLSLIQSLGFGVPVVVARGPKHGPEIDLAVEGVNALFFDEGSTSALGALLVAMAADRDVWVSRRQVISAPIRDSYTIESMVEAFIGALRL